MSKKINTNLEVEGDIILSDGTVVSGKTDLNPVTAKGDIISHDGTDTTVVPIGTDGLVLRANSAVSTGLEWASATGTTVSGKYKETIGDGVATVYTITHNLGEDYPVVQVYEVSSGDVVTVDSITYIDTNSISVTFNVAPASNSHKVVVVGGAAEDGAQGPAGAAGAAGAQGPAGADGADGAIGPTGPSGSGVLDYSSGTLAARPSPSAIMETYYAEDVGIIYVSTDGIEWQILHKTGSRYTDKFTLPIVDRTKKVWYYFGSNNSTYDSRLWRSDNGGMTINYQETDESGQYNGRVFVPFANHAKAISYHASPENAVSYTSWTSTNSSTYSGQPDMYAWASDGHHTILHHATGVHWTQFNGTFPPSRTACAGLPNNLNYNTRPLYVGGLWVVLSTYGEVFTSEDGKTFTQAGPLPVEASYRLWNTSYRGSDGTFWISDSTNDCLWQTDDFSNYTKKSCGFDVIYSTFSPDHGTAGIGRLVAVSSGYDIYYSDDSGDTWTLAQSISYTYEGGYEQVEYTQNYFTAAGGEGLVSWGSPDGINWSQRYSYNVNVTSDYTLQRISVEPNNSKDWLMGELKADVVTGLYDFEAGHFDLTTMYDQSGSSNDITASKNWATSAGTEFPGLKAFKPDGAYGDISYPNTVNSQGSWTFTYYLDSVDNATVRDLLRFDADNRIYIENDDLFIEVGTAVTNVVSGIPAGYPHLWQITCDTSEIRIYCNGILKHTSSTLFDAMTVAPVLIGGEWVTGEFYLVGYGPYVVTQASATRYWKLVRHASPQF